MAAKECAPISSPDTTKRQTKEDYFWQIFSTNVMQITGFIVSVPSWWLFKMELIIKDLQVANVTKTYTQKDKTYRALDDITLDVEAGTLLALLGPSGSGYLQEMEQHISNRDLCHFEPNILKVQKH